MSDAVLLAVIDKLPVMLTAVLSFLTLTQARQNAAKSDRRDTTIAAIKEETSQVHVKINGGLAAAEKRAYDAGFSAGVASMRGDQKP